MSKWRTHIPEGCSSQRSVSTGTVNGGAPCIFMGIWPTTVGTMMIKDGNTELGPAITLTASGIVFPFGDCGIVCGTALSISASAAVGTILFKL